jgi:phospho-N-acetylmuramoyl-pentapeptide-transferase
MAAPLAAFFYALVAGMIIAWPIYRLLLAVKARQTVSQYLGESHQAKQGTPTMGGLIIVISALFSMLVLNVDLRLILLFAGYSLIGLADDYIVPRMMPGKRGLGWIPKLTLQVVVAAACLWSDTGTNLPRLGLALFFILFMANAYNFSDGLDALAGALYIVLAVGILMVYPIHYDGPALPYAIMAVLGGVIPFLFLNAPPAKVFMGDVGSLPIGALLGIAAYHLTILFNASKAPLPGFGAVAVLFLVMIVELVPVPLQILSVKLRKGKRLFPRTPIHHAFELHKWPESRITWTFVLVQIICAFAAIALASQAGTEVLR